MIRKQNLPLYHYLLKRDFKLIVLCWTLNFQVEGEQEEEPPRKKIRLLKVAVAVHLYMMLCL